MHVFITGAKQTGKTTIVRNLLAEYTGDVHGFFSTRIETAYGCKIEFCNFASPAQKHIIGKLHTRQAFTPFPNVLEEAGVKLLQGITSQTKGLVVMDEIGFIESKAPLFQREIERILNTGIPVLATLRQDTTPFLLSLFSRKDARQITLTKENRNTLLVICKKELGIFA